MSEITEGALPSLPPSAFLICDPDPRASLEGVYEAGASLFAQVIEAMRFREVGKWTVIVTFEFKGRFSFPAGRDDIPPKIVVSASPERGRNLRHFEKQGGREFCSIVRRARALQLRRVEIDLSFALRPSGLFKSAGSA